MHDEETAVSRRKFIKTLITAGTSAFLSKAWARAPLMQKKSEKSLRTTLRPGQTETLTVAKLPEWKLGDCSCSSSTLLMFRGNPTHTFYGTGPLPDKLRILWKFQTEKFHTLLHKKPHTWTGTGWTGQASILGHYVFFGSVDRYLYCLKRATGELVWRYRADRMFKGSLCIYRNRIYAPNVDDHLHCLEAATGKLLWRHDTTRDLDSSPCVVNKKLYVAGECGWLRCLDPQSGKLIWKTFVGGIGPGTKPGSNGAESSPAVFDNKVYIGNYFGQILCIDATTGKQIWKTEIGDDTDVSGVVWEDFVFFGAEEKSGKLSCLDRTTGREIWSLKTKRGWYSTPAIVDDKLFAGGNDGFVYCLQASSGKILWRTKIAAPTWCSPAVVDGKVLIGCWAPYFYVLEANSGKIIQILDLKARTHSTPCVVDGKVYVGNASGWFYCLG